MMLRCVSLATLPLLAVSMKDTDKAKAFQRLFKGMTMKLSAEARALILSATDGCASKDPTTAACLRKLFAPPGRVKPASKNPAAKSAFALGKEYGAKVQDRSVHVLYSPKDSRRENGRTGYYMMPSMSVASVKTFFEMYDEREENGHYANKRKFRGFPERCDKFHELVTSYSRKDGRMKQRWIIREDPESGHRHPPGTVETVADVRGIIVGACPKRKLIFVKWEKDGRSDEEKVIGHQQSWRYQYKEY